MTQNKGNNASAVTTSMVKASGLITLLAVISKVLGFVRETVIAAVFGATEVTDSFLIAYMLPSVLFASIGAAIVTVFIPVFTEVTNRQGKQQGFALINKFGTVTLMVVSILVLLGEVFAPAIVKVLAPGFSGETFALTVSLTRLLTPIIILLTVTYLATASLNAMREFAAPAMVGLPYNLIVISVTLLLGNSFGISGLAIGTIFAVISQIIIQLPPLIKSGYRIRLKVDFADSNIKKIGLLIGPVILSSIAGQINIMVDRILASGLAEGSIAALNFANRVNTLPMGLFVISIITVMYPSLSEYCAKADADSFTRHLGKSLGIIAFFTFPISIGFIVLSNPIIEILFQRGAFDIFASRATGVALLYYAIGIAPLALSEMLKRGFWALQDTKTPMYISFVSVGLNIVFNLILVKRMGHGGLALGTSLAAIISTIALFWHMQRRRHVHRTLWSSFGKIALNSAIMAVYCSWVWHVISESWLVSHSGSLNLVLALTAVVTSSAALYFFGAYILKIEEMLWSINLMGKLVARIRR